MHDAVPGPGWLTPLLWRAYARDSERTFRRAFDHYGPAFALWVPGIGRTALLCDPDLIGGVLSAGGLRPFKPRPTAVVWGPRSIFALHGPDHHRVRKLMLPVLGGAAVDRHREDAIAIAERMVDGLPTGTPFELLPHARDALLRAMLRAMFGLTDQRMDRWQAPVRDLLDIGGSQQASVRFVLRGLGATRVWPAFHAARLRCGRLIHDEIARRHRREEDGRDILGQLMRARTADGAALTDAALHDQAISVLVAGFIAPALGLAWAVERLVRHPSALDRLTGEAIAGTGQDYAAAVACEALRQRPPTSIVPLGVTGHTVTVGGYRLRPGTSLLVPLMALHHHPGHFSDPYVFRPERFLRTRPSPFSWLPFGIGPKICAGRTLAILQISTFLQVIARRLILSAAGPPEEGVHRALVSNYPSHGCRITAASRPTHQEGS
ncbi:cytochrome P450 [Nonomuraea purpurea]|uniref:Cytochrome P450 n=1 Tax=Nonomuraea purpurea TaxID=1849276 RepID=A0ABV8GS71_9ACTN